DAEDIEPVADNAGEEDESPRDEISDAFGGDPVRLYVRQMGQATLLTREGEVAIAKRIEEGEHCALGTALATPIRLRHVLGGAGGLQRGGLGCGARARGHGGGGGGAAGAARQRRRFLIQLARIRRLVTEREALGTGGGRRSAAERARRAAKLARIEERLAAS